MSINIASWTAHCDIRRPQNDCNSSRVTSFTNFKKSSTCLIAIGKNRCKAEFGSCFDGMEAGVINARSSNTWVAKYAR